VSAEIPEPSEDSRFEPLEFTLDDLVSFAALLDRPHLDVLVDFRDAAKKCHDDLRSAALKERLAEMLRCEDSIGAAFAMNVSGLQEAIWFMPRRLRERHVSDEEAAIEIAHVAQAMDKERVSVITELYPDLQPHVLELQNGALEEMMNQIYASETLATDDCHVLDARRGEAIGGIVMGSFVQDVSTLLGYVEAQ